MRHTDDLSAPVTALDAARQLAAEGKHVHLVSEGESVCVSEHCPQRISR